MTEFSRTAVLALAPVASLQSVGDGAVVLLADSGQLYTCNQTTEAFLQKVDGVRTFDDILALIREEFEVDEETAATDFAAVAQELIDEGILARR
jgi:pyrroloquinoline quinone biosynthesis protein D